MWGLCFGGHPLDMGCIGTAHHADFPCTPWLRGQPLNGVIAIGGFVRKGQPCTIRVAASPHILNHKSIPVLGKVTSKGQIIRLAVIVRSPHENRGEGACSSRENNVGG